MSRQVLFSAAVQHNSWWSQSFFKFCSQMLCKIFLSFREKFQCLRYVFSILLFPHSWNIISLLFRERHGCETIETFAKQPLVLFVSLCRFYRLDDLDHVTDKVSNFSTSRLFAKWLLFNFEHLCLYIFNIFQFTLLEDQEKVKGKTLKDGAGFTY